MSTADGNSGRPCRVVRVEPENADITSVFIEGHDDKFRQRRAGQYLTLKIQRDDGWSEPHPFTISCAPEDEVLRLTIKKAGEFTSAIPGLKTGDPVQCAGPYGVFCKEIERRKHIVMIAGGVGITPFLSVLRHFRNLRCDNNIVLFWSNRNIDDAFARSELDAMTQELNLKTVHNLSREDNVEKYSDNTYQKVLFVSGRITQELLKEHVGFSDPAYYLCGPPPMQEFVLGQLGAFGIDEKSIERENFSW
jgi:predicted ferric reductase